MGRKTKSEEVTREKVRVARAISGRGRIFQGTVTKKFPTRVVVKFERIIYVKKYERFTRDKTRLHARIPQGMEVNVGDLVKVQECRPLSKIIHFIVIDIVRKAEVKAK